VTPFPTEATKDSARTEAAALVLPAAVLTVAWKMQTEDDRHVAWAAFMTSNYDSRVV